MSRGFLLLRVCDRGVAPLSPPSLGVSSQTAKPAAHVAAGFLFQKRMFAVRALNDVTFGCCLQREQMNFAITSTATR